jgi:transcriptional regulator GlxA family with amidase domain
MLARAGLLDGKAATTNRAAYDGFEKSFPRVKLIRGVRFVDAGAVTTTTGLTAGIDLARHIVERFYGRKTAQDLADYEEWPSQAWQRS